MDDGIRLAVRPEHLSASEGSEVVILNISSGTFYSLNAVGTRVWEILRSGTTFGDLLDSIVNEFNVAPETASRDIARFLADLQGHELILADQPAACADGQAGSG